ncbi:Bifunctional inhibitor/plant lipid transfer protein/seed storage helical domain [Dillenia turbinata]|uniref:Bifunctional inhibitor/plant lipid transfer protein/seed storage helical domain n=1 Tax=Dillenia turbinata TaxID=194707 RepID=A0AAN8Z5A3_9MAGN
MKLAYIAMCMAVVVLVLAQAEMSKAVTCTPTELSSCVSAITSSAPPSKLCCTKIKQQRPCLCQYLKNPTLKQFVNTPNARKDFWFYDRDKAEWEITFLCLVSDVNSHELYHEVLLLLAQAEVSQAVTCSVSELQPCVGAITYSTPPSNDCCTKLKQQKPCFCQYLKDPNLKKFVNNPNAKKVASTCGVSYPKCS